MSIFMGPAELQSWQHRQCDEHGHRWAARGEGILRRGGGWRVERCTLGCGEVRAVLDSRANLIERTLIRVEVGTAQRTPFGCEMDHPGPWPLLVAGPDGAPPIKLTLLPKTANLVAGMRVLEEGRLGGDVFRVGWEYETRRHVLAERGFGLTAPAPLPDGWMTLHPFGEPFDTGTYRIHGEIRIARPT